MTSKKSVTGALGSENLAVLPGSDSSVMKAPLRKPALLMLAEQEQARFFIQFAGQAGSYWADLVNLYEKTPLVRPLIESACQKILELSQSLKSQETGCYYKGFDVLSWLSGENLVPDTAYLASSPISQPLIFITQIAQFRKAQLTGGYQNIIDYSDGVAGHSQGIMAAVLTAMDLKDSAFEQEFIKFVTYMFWQGLRMHQSYVAPTLHKSLIAECEQKDWGKPTEMMSVSGLTFEELSAHLNKINEKLAANQILSVSLINGYKRLIVSGSAQGLILLRRLFDAKTQKESKRLVKTFEVACEFLSVSCPFHSTHMQAGLDVFKAQDMSETGLNISAQDLKIPIYCTETGQNLQESPDLIEDLLRMQYLGVVDWQKSTQNACSRRGITHILDFGPSDMASTMTFLNREGQGVVVIPCATTRGQDTLLASETNKIPSAKTRWELFAPQIKEVSGQKILENRFTRFTGMAPVIGGGMTPTTVEVDIVASAANQGYMVEWAGGGQVTEEMLRKRLDDLKSKLKPGKWISFNSLYLDAYLWNLHYPLLTQLRKEGYPIEGLTISAGVPSRDKAKEIIAQMNRVGVWCLSFKPGSDAQIKSVLEIASDHPEQDFIIQVEGGKAGGHHSWEDLYGLLERNYASIRRRENIILLVGGGIGTEEQAHSYLSGTWHQSGKIMPVDGVILGTRLMACQEAKTSPQIKELLAQAQGTQKWVERGEFAEGVTSGQSQLGADVHYADNNIARVADFVDQVSSLEESEILAKKDEIISKINQTAKPYFGDIGTMTYAQVIQRMVALMAPGEMPAHMISDGAFFDISYRKRVLDFARRMQARLGSDFDLSDESCLDDPQHFVKSFIAHIQGADQILHPEDIDYFLLLCRRPGKPVNFVPVIDSNIKRWFKSDSLWQAHDARYSAEQALTIPGPEALKGITKVDEPVCEIIKSFIDYSIKEIGEIKDIQSISHIGAPELQDFTAIQNSVTTTISENGREIDIIINQTPSIITNSVSLWGQFLASFGQGAVASLLSVEKILKGSERITSFIPQLIFPKAGCRLHIETRENVITSIAYYDGSDAPAVLIQCGHQDQEGIQIYVYHQLTSGQELRLDIACRYTPLDGQAVITIDHEAYQESLLSFYRSLWISEASKNTQGNPWEGFKHSVRLSAKDIKAFAAITREESTSIAKNQVPESAAIVLFWQGLAQCLLSDELKLDLLNLLHLSNSFEFSDDIQQDQEYTALVKIASVTNSDIHQTVQVMGQLITEDQKIIATLKSEFLIRQKRASEACHIQEVISEQKTVIVTDVVHEILNSKKWFECMSDVAIGDELIFDYTSQETRFATAVDYNLTGDVLCGGEKVAQVCFKEKGSSLLQNPIRFFLNEYAVAEPVETPQEQGVVIQDTIYAPQSNVPYAVASQDLNPIHTDDRFAALAALPAGETGSPETIVHGMWTSAATHAVVKRHFARIKNWQAQFVGMVHCGDELTVSLQHVANIQGERIFEVTTKNAQGRVVLKGRACIPQQKTAYVFTGQGSQVTGMGMEAYQKSEAAKKIWDRVESYCQTALGFSIIHVVRDNPKTMLVNGERVSHPKGVLHLTQFTQVGLTVLAMAQVAELKAAGLFQQKDALFAGHSLGEYAGLSCFDILSIEDVVRVVYHRGLTMQNFVPRDESGKSPFGMMVVRPKAIGWSESDLEKEVESLTQNASHEAIYVVNYNIEGSQYSVTGHISLLQKLEQDIQAVEKAKNVKKPACIWVEGVDVPFHSELLKEGVSAFRKTIQDTIKHVCPSILIDRYVPNLNAKPFSLDINYIESVYQLTNSPVLKDVLMDWQEYEGKRDELARLLLIELLAYQFASPVRWIRTQKVLVADPKHCVERVLEIGPSAVLSNMMKATIARTPVAMVPEVYQFEMDREAVFYISEQSSEEVSDEPQAVVETASAKEAPVAVAAAPSAAVAVPDDVALTPVWGLKSLLALKLKLRIDEIKDGDTIEALSGGNSAKRNELLTDIGEEFSVGALDEAHLMQISKLGDVIASQADYTAAGKLITKAISRALKECLPFALSDVETHMAKERLMPQGLLQRALCYLPLAVRPGSSNKSGALSAIGIDARITDKSQAIQWLDQMIDAFASDMGIQIPHASQMSGASAGAAVSEEALNEWQEKYFGKDSPFAKWAKELTDVCGWDDRLKTVEDFTEERELLKLYQSAFGPQIERAIKPKFDAGKIVSLNSAWNWGRSQLTQLFFDALNAHGTLSEADCTIFKIKATKEICETAQYFSTVATSRGLKNLAVQMSEIAEIDYKQGIQYQPRFTSHKPQVTISNKGEVIYQEEIRENGSDAYSIVNDLIDRQWVGGDISYIQAIKDMVSHGVSFKGKTVIITGASPSSIAWEILKAFLMGGAKVIATTTSYNEKRLKAYRKLYKSVASRDSELHVIPFNQGSYDDIEAMMSWCFHQGLIPDYVFPFGAIGEVATLSMMTPDASTATLRVLLQGVEWIIGALARHHKKAFAKDHKSFVILPLSPNHGVFGGDGAYADSKLGLESLLYKWHSEKHDWGNSVTVAGATIGWVRGTGLMEANNVIAATMEDKGARTFSNQEMGFLLTALCHKEVIERSSKEPVQVSLTGGFETVPELGELAKEARLDIEKQSRLNKALTLAEIKEQKEVYGKEEQPAVREVKAPIHSEFPTLPEDSVRKTYRKNTSLSPKDVIVVVGYGETSPFGNSKPRWDMECGDITQTGAIELAWLMGLIRYEDGQGKIKYQGWVDAKSGEPVADDQVWENYKEHIQKNTGVRFADPELQFCHPQETVVFGDVALEQDLIFVVQDQASIDQYRRQYGDQIAVEALESGEFRITIAKGSLIKVPRRVCLKRWVAGQIPAGWEATRYGVTKEMVDQIDRNTIFNLVASAEAFMRAGLEPENLTEEYHPSLIANSQGGGMGGMKYLDRMYHDHRQDNERQGDTLQETLINVGPAWITQSLIGGYGPMVHPVAACATAVVSLSAASDLIGQGKADFVIAGGYDDYSEEGVVGFSDMQATCDTQEMLDKGIEPKSMSRPNDSRRGGFVEAQGGGTLLLTRLDKAIEMGLPIYAVVAFSNSYSDGVHTSIPAPGLGLLGMARGGKDSQLGTVLKRYGMTADDITVVSKHDTSTAANDPNENKIHHLIQEKIGRTQGNPLYVHSQKSLLGHAKGGAGAWQAIGAVQMLTTGKIPGNQNLENVDGKMREFSTMCFTDETLNLGRDEIKGVMMTSLGFGHVGATTLMIHPNYALASLTEEEYQGYTKKRAQRERYHQQKYYRVLMGKETLYERRSIRPTERDEISMLLEEEKS